MTSPGLRMRASMRRQLRENTSLITVPVMPAAALIAGQKLVLPQAVALFKFDIDDMIVNDDRVLFVVRKVGGVLGVQSPGGDPLGVSSAAATARAGERVAERA